MIVYVNVSNAEWLDGCADTEDHDHPPEFTAFVVLPDDIDYTDRLAMESAVHDALIEQCECCVIECDIVVERIVGMKDMDQGTWARSLY